MPLKKVNIPNMALFVIPLLVDVQLQKETMASL